eukprot:CAMPEP_0198239616 /NCGR_PEP_ID=MMETSP1446-20131203/4976_1 /TAXON_ID=1461542 ORGANISM="Unidentified sp, Strain CCMP2111" /NCGR_SAMPLE_ID=MMETSP1446 /ASSEMBLY_ACC=CAM_ASM_001112 /LENGTH=154 /DNA_ID=CAMNT_0043922241 /DNA_START=140 /DNA_END=603 /DNA_ORIENTATION=+
MASLSPLVKFRAEKVKNSTLLPSPHPPLLHPSVVQEASLVEYDLRDVQVLALVRDFQPHFRSRFFVGASIQPLPQVGRECRRRAQGVPLPFVLGVVNHLSVNVLVRPEDRQPRPFRRPVDVPPLALVPLTLFSLLFLALGAMHVVAMAPAARIV